MVDLPKSVDLQRRTAPAAHCPQTANAPSHQVYPTSCQQSIWTPSAPHKPAPK